MNRAVEANLTMILHVADRLAIYGKDYRLFLVYFSGKLLIFGGDGFLTQLKSSSFSLLLQNAQTI